jgi:hypothetical protein
MAGLFDPAATIGTPTESGLPSTRATLDRIRDDLPDHWGEFETVAATTGGHDQSLSFRISIEQEVTVDAVAV